MRKAVLFGRAPAPPKCFWLSLLWWSGFSGGVESFEKTFDKIAPLVDF
jgi:hypothetical protein